MLPQSDKIAKQHPLFSMRTPLERIEDHAKGLGILSAISRARYPAELVKPANPLQEDLRSHPDCPRNLRRSTLSHYFDTSNHRKSLGLPPPLDRIVEIMHSSAECEEIDDYARPMYIPSCQFGTKLLSIVQLVGAGYTG